MMKELIQHKKRTIYYYQGVIGMFVLFSILSTILSCKKLVDVPSPYSSLNAGNVYANDATAISALTAIYTNMASAPQTYGGIPSISYFGGLSADEFTLYTGVTDQSQITYYKNSLSAQQQGNNTASSFWNSVYPPIYNTNAALEGLNTSTTLTPAVKQQLIGEAKFMRAFFYFYLVNLYGDVPLALSSDYKVNGSLSRTAKTLVWQQIIADLTDAQGLLNPNFPDATLLTTSAERIRPTKWAATAMLARAYLYNAKYDLAEQQANLLLNGNSLFALSTLDNTFLKASSGNKEAIWQLQPVNTGQNTSDAITFTITATGPGSGAQPCYLNNILLTSFENRDLRRYQRHWIDSVNVGTPAITYYFPRKYKVNILNQPVSEYEMVLRLGEQYLIRAEARAQQNKLPEAVADLNVIRNRAGLANISGTIAGSQTALLAVIYHERQVELFTEWGHRWLDLKRTNTIDAVMSTVTPQKGGGAWSSNKALFPVPLTEIQYNPNLTQNPGY